MLEQRLQVDLAVADVFAENDLVTQLRELPGDLGHGGRMVEARPAVDRDAHRRAEPRQHPLQLARPDGRSDRRRGRAEAGTTQHERIDLPPVGQLDRDRLARADTELAEGSGEPLHLLGVLGVCHVQDPGIAPRGGDGDGVRGLAGPPPQVGGWGLVPPQPQISVLPRQDDTRSQQQRISHVLALSSP
ncbi:hypothetical protein GCM10009608_03870 [Pseudonocardia alaniniphila]